MNYSFDVNFNLDIDKTKFCIITGTTFGVTAGIFFVRKISQNRTRKKKLRRSATNDLQLWESLINMDTGEFLTTFSEYLIAFSMGNLAMSRERLKVIAVTKQKQLRAKVDSCKKDLEEQLVLMGSVIYKVKHFIMDNLVNAEHRSLSKIKDFFEKFAQQLDKVSDDPNILLDERKEESLSYAEIYDLLTIVIFSSATKRTLRAEARRLRDELETSWDDLRKSKSSYNHAIADVRKWMEFAEENSELIAEVLDVDEWWPES